MEQNYTLVDCNIQLSKFSDDVKPLVSQTLSLGRKLYCLNFTEESHFSNEFGGFNSSYFLTLVNFCGFFQRSPNNPCMYDKNKDFITDQLVIVMHSLDSYVNPTDIQNPVKSHITSQAFLVFKGLMKNVYMRIIENSFDSDNGWILEANKKTPFLKLKDKEVDIADGVGGKNLIFSSAFESPRIAIVYNRKYYKIQDLFANIGGIANALLIIVNILTSNFLRYKNLFNLLSSTFCVLDSYHMQNSDKIVLSQSQGNLSSSLKKLINSN